MACNFTALKIVGQDQVLLVHSAISLTDPGFGPFQGVSTVRITNNANVNRDLGLAPVWTSGAILANLPANLAAGTYTVTVNVSAPACTATATLTLGQDPLSDLLFAAASPLVTDLGATVEIINTKPGFTWQQSVHQPVDLLTLTDTVVNPAPQIVSGWGSNRLKVTLPSSTAYALQEPVQAHTFRFNGFSQRVPIVLRAAALDPITVTIVFPTLVVPEQTLGVLNFTPGFSWSQTQHGVPQMLDHNHQPAPAPPTYVSGWGTQILTLRLPPAAQFPTTDGKFATFLKFASSPHELSFEIVRVTIPTSVLPPVLQRIMIETLTCITTEDWLGGDECRLEVRPDVWVPGTGVVKLPWLPMPEVGLNDGDSYDYDVPFTFFEEVKVRLFDSDVGGPGDPDDNLGENTIKAGDARTEVKFTGDGADYTLTFKVVPAFP